MRDARLIPQIGKVYEDNLQVYEADNIWDQLNKNGTRVARCTVERLIRQIGIQGCRRGRTWVGYRRVRRVPASSRGSRQPRLPRRAPNVPLNRAGITGDSRG